MERLKVMLGEITVSMKLIAGRGVIVVMIVVSMTLL